MTSTFVTGLTTICHILLIHENVALGIISKNKAKNFKRKVIKTGKGSKRNKKKGIKLLNFYSKKRYNSFFGGI